MSRITSVFAQMEEHKVKFPAEPGNEIFRVNVSEVARWIGFADRQPFYKNNTYKTMLQKAIKKLGIEGGEQKSKTESLLENNLDERWKDIGSLKRQVQTLIKEKSSLKETVEKLEIDLLKALSAKEQADRRAIAAATTAKNQRANLLDTGGRGYEWL
jgi:regulator of replication initiation timing